MRGAYLKSSSHNNKGCRGGVGSFDGDYELEIGNNQNASPQMLALCMLIDEITEHLKTSESSIGKMIYQQYVKNVDTLCKQQEA